MSKERKNFRLSTEDVSYINSLAEKYQIDSTKALERIRLAANGAERSSLILLGMME